MTRRTKIIIGIIVVLILALIAALFLLRKPGNVGVIDVLPGGEKPAATGLPEASNPNRGSTATEQPVPAQETAVDPNAKPDETSSIKRFASAFAERFGSFSNQTDFVNITDLAPFMTADMQAWAEAYVEDARSSGADTTVYSGTTTRALMAEVTAFDEAKGTATVRVGTQRSKAASGTEAAEVYYQGVVLELVKINGEWKADSATWEARQ
jgi:hypothetical protein